MANRFSDNLFGPGCGLSLPCLYAWFADWVGWRAGAFARLRPLDILRTSLLRTGTLRQVRCLRASCSACISCSDSARGDISRDVHLVRACACERVDARDVSRRRFENVGALSKRSFAQLRSPRPLLRRRRPPLSQDWAGSKADAPASRPLSLTLRALRAGWRLAENVLDPSDGTFSFVS